MAIVVEEEKKSSVSPVNVLMWLILLICIGMGAYYVFFKDPDLLTLSQPASFQSTQQLANIQLHPELVVSRIQQPSFQAYVTISSPKTSGRSNPFLSF